MNDSSNLDVLGSPFLRALERAALAVGRLDALGRSAEPGVRDLLALRCSVVAAGVPSTACRDGIIALLRADGEGGDAASRLAAVFAEGAARSRAGTAPTARWVHDQLGEGEGGHDLPRELDEHLRAMRPPASGVLPALVAARTLVQGGGRSEARTLSATALAALVLHHAGSLGGLWCTIPAALVAGMETPDLVQLADALATAAHDAAHALAAATAALPVHEAQVRAAHGRAARGATAVLRAFRRWSVLEIPSAARRLRCTRPTVAAAIDRLETLGLVTELTGRGRDRVWCYAALADAMVMVPR